MSFDAMTRVAMASGAIEIDKVKMGQKTLTHAGRWRPILDVTERLFDDELVSIVALGSSFPLLASPDQMFLVHDLGADLSNWKVASAIGPGDYLVNQARQGAISASVVVRVGRQSFEGYVYSLSVQDDDSYVAAGRIVKG